MACQDNNLKSNCNCNFNIKSFGVCDPRRVTINGSDRTVLNWSEISVPEILCVPEEKPDIENIDQVYATAEITSVKLIETPFASETVNRLVSPLELTNVTAVLTTITTDVIDILDPVFNGASSLISLLLAALSTAGITVPGLSDAITNATDALAALVDYMTTLVTPTSLTLASALCDIYSTLSGLLTTLEGYLSDLFDLLSPLIGTIGSPVSNVTDILTSVIDLLLGDPTATPPTIGLIDQIASYLLGLGAVSYITIISNEEGTCLTGRKLVVEGFINQKIVYTGNVDAQSVHSAHFSVPFSAFIIPYAKFDGLEFDSNVSVYLPVNGVSTLSTISGVPIGCDETAPTLIPDLSEEFCVEVYIEDIFASALDVRTIFKNLTLFFLAKPISIC